MPRIYIDDLEQTKIIDEAEISRVIGGGNVFEYDAVFGGSVGTDSPSIDSTLPLATYGIGTVRDFKLPGVGGGRKRGGR